MIAARHLALAFALVAAMAVVACKGNDAPPPSTAAPAAVAPPTATGSAPASDVKAVAPAQDLTPLGSRFQYESQHRPSVGPTVEQVFDALDKAGIAVVGRTQYVGAAMHAAYCAGGHGSGGLVVAICEYATPEAAIAGKAFIDEHFQGTPDANRRAHRGTVLTLNGTGATPELTAKAFAAFDSL